MPPIEQKPAAPRGRPPTITRELLADAGIALTLPAISIVAMAAELGVSQMALYKHVSGLGSLKELVAEETLKRWRLPELRPGTREDLKRYLMELSVSTWKLVEAHPGIAPYLLREDMIMPSIVAKIRAHQEDAAKAFGLSFEQANWLLFTVAYHCVAVADTVLPRRAGDAQTTSARGEDGIDPEYAKGIRALIVGALVLLDDDDGCQAAGSPDVAAVSSSDTGR